MKALVVVVLLFGLSPIVTATVLEGSFIVTDKYPGGFTGRIDFPATQDYRYGWLLNITFNIEVTNFQVFEGVVIGSHPNNRYYVVQHQEHNRILHRDALGKKRFFCQGACSGQPTAEVYFIPMLSDKESIFDALRRKEGESENSQSSTVITTTTSPFLGTWTPPVFTLFSAVTTTRTTSSTTQSSTTTKPPPPPNLGALNLRYNLRDVITKSLLFIESQRSGLLPDSNRIPWRSHSALSDGSDNHVDLSGGYYIDGGFVKYGFPMAYSTTMLAWGVLEFRNAYLASHQIAHVMNALKWATDYFLKCHTAPFVFYGQISTAAIDQKYWGRPEDFKGYRPSFKIDRRRPGSDLAAETAAAMAATAMVFKKTNSTYSTELLKHAEQLYRFAVRYPGKYSDSIKEAGPAYKSWNGYHDELAWGAAWLYKATKKNEYLTDSKQRLATNPDKSAITSFSWDDKRAGAILLLAQITRKSDYINSLTTFCDSFLPGRGTPYTPRGLVFINEWGPTKYAANAGIICLLTANLGVRPDIYRRFAHQQLAYMLGDGGRSLVVGFGKDPPKRPYHRASSCPDQPASCSWADKEAKHANPQQLTGALVAGPNKWDGFDDDRNDYKHNAVGLDYNAALQTLAAGILELQVTGQTFSEPNHEELVAAVSQTFSVKHNYGEIIRLSLLFYEAQRAGELPDGNRVSWRHSAFVNDSGHNGVDLSGGYFDAGDYVKFNFPMAYTTTTLAWGLIQYWDAYKDVGELENCKSAIKWATDYFIKCHVSKFVLYAQVGSGKIDHSYWLTPDEMAAIPRPSFNVTSKRPGSEVVAETAAAMAAASIVFRESDPDYSNTLISHARELFQFANKYREKYHRSVRDAYSYYGSISGYKDEMVWSALWMYMATTEQKYINYAQIEYQRFKLAKRHLHSFFWDDKTAGVQLLLAQITRKQKYRKSVERFCDQFLQESGHKYTPRGLVYINDWGPLRHAAGVAFVCLGAANLNIRPQRYRKFAKRQIHYMLGDSGLGSFVVGYGPSPPTRPHHRSSSCPEPPSRCGFHYLHSRNRNPHVLYGALIGGPDINDQFNDERSNHKSNEVAIDYNAAFQSAVAGLKYLQMHPPVTTTPEPPQTTARLLTTVAFEDSFTDFSDIEVDIDGWLSFEDYKDTVEITTVVATQPPTSVTTANSSYNQSNDVTTLLGERATTANLTTTDASTSAAKTQTTPFTSSNTSPNQTEYKTTIPHTTTVITTPGLVASETTSGLHSTTLLISQASSPVVNSPNAETTTYEKTTSILPVTTPLPRTIKITRPPKVISYPNAVIYKDECLPVEVFNLCAISRWKYRDHQASAHFYCRFEAFKSCANQQSKACSEKIFWNTFPYWNSRIADDNEYFSDDELSCKDPKSVAREKCKVGAITRSFQDCYDASGSADPNNFKLNTTSCRWELFESCTNDLVGHCVNTWYIWKHWNLKTGIPYFNSTQRQCNKAVLASSCPYYLLCIFLSLLCSHSF